MGLMPRIYDLFESWIRPLDEESALQPPARLVPFVWHYVRQAKAPFGLKGRRGYDAHVGERGVQMSGGERQRIAISRIFLKNAPIVILDEATSAMDSEVEAAIQENLHALMHGKTVIAVAHRLSTIAHLDRLVVLAGGRVVESGTHAELLAAGGAYARLWQRQSGGILLPLTSSRA